MSEKSPEMALVRQFLGPLFRENPPHLAELLEDTGFQETARELMSAEAQITFEVPYGDVAGAGLGPGPYTGYEGFIAGWVEWLTGFERFEFGESRLEDAGGGRIVLLVDCVGVLHGSEAEIRQPAAAIYSVRDSLITSVRHFLDQGQARQEAGIG